ncbi:MAG TPA: Lrp/AsnC family transcriptional regulator [Beijerinckiaceae bacterium]|nr:Lrp/AsnC family transcriptional regulator [Beijerinckiaceae bacterium]
MKSADTPLDAIDARILAELQRDGRMTITDLAERVGLSASPCLRRVRMLEDAGVIAGYVAVVDQNKVGLEVNVFASIRLERQREEELERFNAAVAQWPEVMECYLMTGTRDYLMRIVVGSLGDYERFIKEKLSRLDGVASIESSFALSRVKHATAVPIVQNRR